MKVKGLGDVLELVTDKFMNKVDKGGNPYMYHLIGVAKSNKWNDVLFMASLLHDIVEDTDVTLEYLTTEGYDLSVIEIVDLVTIRKGEKYNDRIDTIINSENMYALLLKRADLENNMDITRLKVITEKDVVRISTKYAPAWIKINNKINQLLGGHINEN